MRNVFIGIKIDRRKAIVTRNNRIYICFGRESLLPPGIPYLSIPVFYCFCLGIMCFLSSVILVYQIGVAFCVPSVIRYKYILLNIKCKLLNIKCGSCWFLQHLANHKAVHVLKKKKALLDFQWSLILKLFITMAKWELQKTLMWLV